MKRKTHDSISRISIFSFTVLALIFSAPGICGEEIIYIKGGQLYQMDLKSGSETILNHQLIEDEEVLEYKINPNGRSVLYIAKTKREDFSPPPFTFDNILFHVDLKSGNTTRITDSPTIDYSFFPK